MTLVPTVPGRNGHHMADRCWSELFEGGRWTAGGWTVIKARPASAQSARGYKAGGSCQPAIPFFSRCATSPMSTYVWSTGWLCGRGRVAILANDIASGKGLEMGNAESLFGSFVVDQSRRVLPNFLQTVSWKMPYDLPNLKCS